jgi:hypothetical protein
MSLIDVLGGIAAFAVLFVIFAAGSRRSKSCTGNCGACQSGAARDATRCSNPGGMDHV